MIFVKISWKKFCYVKNYSELRYCKTKTKLNKEKFKIMETTASNPCRDERLVRINEIISTKLSSVSKNKRAFLKLQKPAAKCILENWDKVEALEYLATEKFKESYYELYCIVRSRIDQLTPKVEEKPAPKATTETPNRRGRKPSVIRKVGDVHPNGKWVWTEYAPNKFDWRAIRGRAVSGQKEGNKSEKAVSKASNLPKAPKVSKTTEKPEKVRSIEEILANKPSGLSKAQESIFKLLRKGYHFIADPVKPANAVNGFLEKDGDRKAVNLVTAATLFDKLQVTKKEMEHFAI